MRTILRLWIFGSLMRALAPAAAADHLGAVPATVDRVIDGDTLKVSALIWIDQSLSVSVRIKGVDAPELFRPRCKAEKMRAREAKAFLEALVAGGAVMLHDIEHDKYGGRVAARVTTGSGVDLGEALIAEGLAVEAGARDPWCG